MGRYCKRDHILKKRDGSHSLSSILMGPLHLWSIFAQVKGERMHEKLPKKLNT